MELAEAQSGYWYLYDHENCQEDNKQEKRWSLKEYDHNKNAQKCTPGSPASPGSPLGPGIPGSPSLPSFPGSPLGAEFPGKPSAPLSPFLLLLGQQVHADLADQVHPSVRCPRWNRLFLKFKIIHCWYQWT